MLAIREQEQYLSDIQETFGLHRHSSPIGSLQWKYM